MAGSVYKIAHKLGVFSPRFAVVSCPAEDYLWGGTRVPVRIGCAMAKPQCNEELEVYRSMDNRVADVVHIVNGDALAERFPLALGGDMIVMRECLVDGPVSDGGDLEEFFRRRAQFLGEAFGGVDQAAYQALSVSEFERIRALPAGTQVVAWFEDDLFCQVNFWFVCHLLNGASPGVDLRLARPAVHTPFGFGGLTDEELLRVFEARVPVRPVGGFAGLWRAYAEGDPAGLRAAGEALGEAYAFVPTAIEAHLARIPREGDPGRPVRTLIEIMRELQTEEFGPVFREFCAREPGYGFGDAQVRRLMEGIRRG